MSNTGLTPRTWAAISSRPYDLARTLADELGLILVPGVEITRPAPGTPAAIPVGSGHFNALFVKDPKALETELLQEALRRARAQGAFVIWDHPGFMGTLEPRWHPHVEEAHREGLFQGVELVNGKDFYPAVFPWVTEKHLTILASSDAHRPIPPRSVGGPRAITLLWARKADVEGVREALEARRTAAWLGEDVWGAEEQLRGLWNAALELSPTRPAGRPGQRLVLRARNGSAIPFRVRPRTGPPWLRLDPALLEPTAISLLNLHVASDAPAGRSARDPRNQRDEPAHRARSGARRERPPRGRCESLKGRAFITSSTPCASSPVKTTTPWPGPSHRCCGRCASTTRRPTAERKSATPEAPRRWTAASALTGVHLRRRLPARSATLATSSAGAAGLGTCRSKPAASAFSRSSGPA